MKYVYLALSAALATATTVVALDDASAARRAGGVRAGGYGGVHAGGVHRRGGVAYRSGMVGRGGYHAGGRYWNRPGWGVGAAGLALGAGAVAATAAYNYGGYGGYGGYDSYASYDGGEYFADSAYDPPRAAYVGRYISPSDIGPICNPQFDRGCQ